MAEEERFWHERGKIGLIRLGLLFLASLGIALTSPTFVEVRSIDLPAGYVIALAGAQKRAMRDKKEEFYCYIGTQTEDHIEIHAAYKPPQYAWNKLDDHGRITHYFVNHTRCPPGTIADAHTHPPIWSKAPYPSEVDLKFWDKTSYGTHIITYWNGLGKVGMAVWTRDSTGYHTITKDFVGFI